MMRFHLPALPGQPTTFANSSCAYTQKIAKYKRMMEERGHEVITYGSEAEDVACYRPGLPALDPPPFEPGAWADSNERAAAAINERQEDGDFLLLAMGECQRSLAAAVPLMAVEYGVGYGGVFTDYRVFESYAWMHTVYGNLYGTHTADGRFYDAVIPNYFEVQEFPFRSDKDDYFLYVGRLTERKGIRAAEEAAERLGTRLIIAGEGEYRPGYGECIGHIGPEQRGELMSGARALFCPTIYVEPFGGVAVEAMLCGTPVISTDWGAFTETVQQGVTGFRCRSLAEFVWAAEHIHELDPQAVRDYAIAHYSTDVVAPRYEHYFEHLQTLHGAGWYDLRRTAPAF